MARATAAVKCTPAAGAGTTRDIPAERDVRPQARGELRERGGDPVVGVGGHDHPGAAGALLGDPQRQVVRLAAGAGEHRPGGRAGSCVASSRSA